ncbi:hypothetical protein [Streptomyces sp. SID13726]|uniref:hypothetical protein n=1 Tax=Streptomyces sp. SID13726 TaxID=2706058 RepID=UPI0013BAB008|nr:hypothetical protein [Streptomyces sp. SID13726]NEB04508.1 hypothetical protein [Streptomyces sp. SID13726]
MSFITLTGVRLFAVGTDLTGASNKVEISGEFEEKDRTTYGSNGWKEVTAGLGSAELTGEGFWEAGADNSYVDNASWAALGGTGPWSAGPVGASVGDLAYFLKALRADYNFGGQVGDLAPWKGKASSTWPLVRGQFGHPPGTARTSSGTGTGVQLGAVASGRRLYAALHVLGASGTTPTLNVVVESDNSNSFPSPVTQLTFTQANAIGGEILRTDGTAITDDWHRVKWTIGGTTPSFLFAVAFGIQA